MSTSSRDNKNRRKRERYHRLRSEDIDGHRKLMRKRQSKWIKKHPEEYLTARAKTNARRRGYPTPTRRMPGACECCGNTEARLHLDHCHQTGKFRGWICFKCNVGMGLLGDSRANIERVLKYLRGFL